MYALPSSDFYDVTSGGNSGFQATTGYDKVTGLGTPNANAIVTNLVYGTSTTTTTTTTKASATTTTSRSTTTTAPPAPTPPAPCGLRTPPASPTKPPSAGSWSNKSGWSGFQRGGFSRGNRLAIANPPAAAPVSTSTPATPKSRLAAALHGLAELAVRIAQASRSTSVAVVTPQPEASVSLSLATESAGHRCLL